jgi:hypothetical protein
MGLFRALNLLQGVEAQTTLGADLESILSSSPAREAEFGAMLSTRHMARRMAGNPITMDAIVLSATAIRVVFTKTTLYNFRPIEEIAAHSVSMLSTSTDLSSLESVIDNDVAWSYYNASNFYEVNIVNTLCTLLGVDANDYANVGELIVDTEQFGNIATNIRTMKALVASTPAMAIVASNSAAMSDIAANNNAMTIVANNDAAVSLIANSQIALDEITPAARLIVLGIPSALFIFANNEDAWDYILSTSVTLSSNIYTLLISLGGLNSATYVNVAAIFSDTTASFAIANSKPAMMAIIYEAEDATAAGRESAMDKLLASDNLGTVLGSSVAITEISADVATMGNMIASQVAFPILLTSSAAKATIFSTPSLVTIMMTVGSASLATVQGLGVSATITNDALIGTYKSAGIAGNIILLTGVMGSIVATTLANTFRSGDDAGTESTFNLPGTSLTSGPVAISLPFTDLKWDVNSIAATAAAHVTITYADFN